MTSRQLDLRQTIILSDSLEDISIDSYKSFPTKLSSSFDLNPGSYTSSIEALNKILIRLVKMELPGKDHVEAYLRDLTRRNRRPKTLYSRWGAIVIFLGMIRDSGKTCAEEITRRDVEAFIEHEQDRGNKITTIRTSLVSVQAFLRYLVEEGIVSPDVFGRRIRLQLPERLPRAMDPDDLRKLLSAIDDTRDRAMILMLLRTGMRIGEVLTTKVVDVHLKEHRIEIYEAEKNRLGRVVYISDDAMSVLKSWLKMRDLHKEFLFYARGKKAMSYSTARQVFANYLRRAGLDQKGYTVHTLRHTFATELLNAGMRLECLQALLGHRCIEETRRYARLTDKTREEEYFKAMSRIERGESNGDDRRDHELEAFFEKEELFTQYR
jgi:Site-specific recombinase XerD